MNHVIKLTRQGPISIVVLEDKEFGNTFTQEFINGLLETFEILDQDPGVKVIIIHGYDNYFCCGGTKEELIGLHEGIGKKEGEGKVRFTDSGFCDLFLRCEVPVIAACRGMH